MNLTGSEIEQDIYNLLKGSSIETIISGSVYKSGLRPINSNLEDAIVTFLAGISNQIQTGVVNLNIYVPDIILNGQNVKNTARIETIEAEIKTWFETLVNIKYEIKLDSTIKVFEEPDIQQHFINTRLNFKLLT